MIRRADNLSKEELKKVQKTVGEAFVSNELFHNWGTEDERRDDVLKYMSRYVDYVYRAGELYVNHELTGFIGLEDSAHRPVIPRIRMILRMLKAIPYRRMKAILHYADQVGSSNKTYAKGRHLDVLMVCVDRERQGQGIASELVRFAKGRAEEMGVPLLFDTDMEAYAEIYQHLGCELYNTVTADNGVTRYSLCYDPESSPLSNGHSKG